MQIQVIQLLIQMHFTRLFVLMARLILHNLHYLLILTNR